MLFIVVLYTAITDSSYTFKKKDKAIQFVCFITTFFITSIALYITCTDVAKPFVWGYQSRYLTPVLPLILVNINSKRVIQVNDEDEYNNTAMIIGLITIINLIFMVI